MKLIINATIEAISTRLDGTIKIALGTQELGPGDGGKLLELRNKYVKCLISTDNIESEVVAVVTDTPMTKPYTGKSQSKRLRDVLWLVSNSIKHPNPEAYYQAEMERIISHYKTKLE